MENKVFNLSYAEPHLILSKDSITDGIHPQVIRMLTSIQYTDTQIITVCKMLNSAQNLVNSLKAANFAAKFMGSR